MDWATEESRFKEGQSWDLRSYKDWQTLAQFETNERYSHIDYHILIDIYFPSRSSFSLIFPMKISFCWQLLIDIDTIEAPVPLVRGTSQASFRQSAMAPHSRLLSHGALRKHCESIAKAINNPEHLQTSWFAVNNWWQLIQRLWSIRYQAFDEWLCDMIITWCNHDLFVAIDSACRSMFPQWLAVKSASAIESPCGSEKMWKISKHLGL